jgi:hypothetical protein
VKDDTKVGRLSRRSALRWIAAAPAAAAAAGAAFAAQAKPKDEAGSKEKDAGASKEPARPSSYARFISKDEPTLTGEQRKQLLKQAPGLEKALAKLRDYPIPDDVEPAFTFQALRGKSRVRS